MISGYLGQSDAFDQALARFALAYADQTERDHAALVKAVKAGRVQVDRREVKAPAIGRVCLCYRHCEGPQPIEASSTSAM